jgi:transposase
MRTKLFTRSKDEIIKEADTILQSNDDAAFHYKVTLVSLVLHGLSVKEAAESASVDVRAIQKWVKTADEQGVDALRPSKATGRPPLLSDIQKSEIKAAIEGSPEEYGYRVWEGKSVSEFIKQWYGIKISVRSCQNLLSELGFSLLRPQPHPNHQKDQSPRDEFKKN